MKKTASAIAVLSLAAGSLAIAGPANAAPAATPTAVVQIQEGHRDDGRWIFGLPKPRTMICNIAPWLC